MFTCLQLHEIGLQLSGSLGQPTYELGLTRKRLNRTKVKNNWTVDLWPKVPFSNENEVCFSFEIQGQRVWRKTIEGQIKGWAIKQ